jgi:hypothetical protein
MTGVMRSGRFAAAIGLIAAYGIALQTLFAAFAPFTGNMQTAEVSGWRILCFGSRAAAPADAGDPAMPAPASGNLHCVLCGSTIGSAVLPEFAAAPVRECVIYAVAFATAPIGVPTQRPTGAANARAPPLTV